MSYQYVRMGNQCDPQTRCALTSNAKYIMPLSSVYFKKYTPMMYYPGHDSPYSADADKLHVSGEPEHIKAYKVTDRVFHEHTHDQPVQRPSKSCTSCNMWN